ncbi:hypothetical protein [Yeosuana sp. AK3]
MKIKYLKLESGDNFKLNTLPEEVKHEYLDVSHNFKLENDTLKIKNTFQHINFLLKFYNCFYVKRNSGLITQIENYEVEAHEKNYERGFLKGYKKATIPDINNSFKIIKGGYDLIYNLPKEYHLERYLLVDKSTREKDYYYDEQERKIEYCNLCFYDYGKSVGEYISRWDTLLNHFVNGKPGNSVRNEKDINLNTTLENLNNTLSILKTSKVSNKPKQKQNTKGANSFTPKEIKIAYFCLSNEKISKNNYFEILEKYSNSRSDKILQNPIYKSNQLTVITENKTADTKHLNALKNAERLLSGIKDIQALKSINQFISTFENNYKNHYE